MKFKFNWGWGIAIFYGAFVVFVVGNVLYSTLLRTDLVEEDYYKKELEYQQKIDKLKRAKSIGQDVELIQGASTIAIKFPDYFKGKKVEGDIHFYRPSNASYDKFYKIDLNDENFQTIVTTEFPKGFWRVKIDWLAMDSTYFFEKDLSI